MINIYIKRPTEILIITMSPSFTESPASRPTQSIIDDEGEIQTTVTATDQPTESENGFGDLSVQTYIYLALSIFAFCLSCCCLLLIWKRRNQKKLRDASSPSSVRMIDDERDSEDKIFDKMTNELIKMDIADKQRVFTQSSNDIFMANEESLSAQAEELYVPHTQTSTIRSQLELAPPTTLLDSVNGWSRIQSMKYSLQRCESNSALSHSLKPHRSHDLSLQHQVTLAISHQHGMRNMNAADEKEEDDEEGIKETICDIEKSSAHSKEEEQAIDVYKNVNALSCGNKSVGTLQDIAQKTVSLTPESELYGISNRDDDGIYQKPSLCHDTEGSNDYYQIEQCLKLCDQNEWQKYLKNFRQNKVSDCRVSGLDPNDWKELLPPIGVRNEFKALWNQYERQKDKALHA